MRILKALAAAALLAACAIPVYGKSLTATAMDSAMVDHKIITLGSGGSVPRDSAAHLIQRFYEDQFRHFQDPLAPYFLFLSRDANVAMGVGGAVRMRLYYDWGGSVPTPGFAPYMIPMEKDPLRDKYFGTTPAGTALFFRVLGVSRKLGQYQVYLEANFNGYEARDFHLKKAYGEIGDWTIGYANSTFSDPSALPPTVDASGPNAKISATAVLVRWSHTFRHRLSMAASIESPSNSIDARPDITAKVSPYIPDIAVYGQAAFNGDDHVRLAAVCRSLSYRDLIAGRNHTVEGWGLQLSAKLTPLPALTIYGMINGGRGYQSLGGDWLMGKYDLVPDEDRAGRLYAPGAVGGYAAVQYNISPSMFFSATYGATRYLPKGTPDPDGYKSGMYMALNYFYYLTPRISCAAEFNLGRRLNFDGKARWARRVGAMMQFSF